MNALPAVCAAAYCCCQVLVRVLSELRAQVYVATGCLGLPAPAADDTAPGLSSSSSGGGGGHGSLAWDMASSSMPSEVAQLLARLPGSWWRPWRRQRYVVGPDLLRLCRQDWPLEQVQQVLGEAGSRSCSSLAPITASAVAPGLAAPGAAVYAGCGHGSRCWGDVVGAVEAGVTQCLQQVAGAGVGSRSTARGTGDRAGCTIQ
jgi:hypothetical protein